MLDYLTIPHYLLISYKELAGLADLIVEVYTLVLHLPRCNDRLPSKESVLDDSVPIVAFSDLAAIATIMTLKRALVPELEELVGKLLHVRKVQLVAHFVHQEEPLPEDAESVECTAQQSESVMLNSKVQVALVFSWNFGLSDNFISKQLLPSVECVLHPLIYIFPSPEPS